MRTERKMKLISVTYQLLQLDWVPAPAVDDGPPNDGQIGNLLGHGQFNISGIV